MFFLVSALLDFALSALNVYLGVTTSGNAAIGWAAAAFCFGMGVFQLAMYVANKGR
mgnify:CR=1 FL=1